MTACRKPEVLAPVGNPEMLRQAIAAGAGAVYLAYTAFGARASAANFDSAALADAIRLAHLHHVRVYVTVNTLVKDHELAEVEAVLKLLRDLHADAVLVQDLGVVRIAKRITPEFALHASTQMAIHNATGARFCRSIGMSRVVLARECSLREIRLAADEGIEVETFAHGAQCVSVSGQCLFSSMVGGRSGNRGRCAQPCRKRYRFRGQEGAWLSPRDNCLRDALPGLLDAGVASLKIEGRLKRPEYVHVVTESYRRAADAWQNGHFAKADDAERARLMQVFHRGGFMPGYAGGAEDAAVIDPSRVNHGGMPIGTLELVQSGMARLRLTASLHNGDGLQLRGRFGDRDLTYSGPEKVPGDIALLRLRPGLKAEAGDTVVRLIDQHQVEETAAQTLPLIPLDGILTTVIGQPLRLTLTNGGTRVTVEGRPAEAPKANPTAEEELRRAIAQMGGTAWRLRSLKVVGTDAFVPVSALKALRRDALAAMERARLEAFEHSVQTIPTQPVNKPPQAELPDRMVIVRFPEAAVQAAEAGAIPCWYPEDFRPDALTQAVPLLPKGCWFRLPTVCEEGTLQALHTFVRSHADAFAGVMLGSVGQLGLHWPIPMAASADVPVMNAEAAAFLIEQGCSFVTASPECTAQEWQSLQDSGLPMLLPAYGRAQMMLLHHCPARTALGLTHGHASCTLCDLQRPESLIGAALTDEMDHRFPLQRIRLPEGCVIRLLNDLPTDVRQKLHAPLLLERTTETDAQMAAVLGGREATETVTLGHWNRITE